MHEVIQSGKTSTAKYLITKTYTLGKVNYYYLQGKEIPEVPKKYILSAGQFANLYKKADYACVTLSANEARKLINSKD